MDPDQIVARVSRDFPGRSEALWTGIENRTITPFDYMQGWVVLIDLFEKQAYVQRLERQLNNLQAG